MIPARPHVQFVLRGDGNDHGFSATDAGERNVLNVGRVLVPRVDAGKNPADTGRRFQVGWAAHSCEVKIK